MLNDRVALVESAQMVDDGDGLRKRKATVRFEDEMANDKEYQHTAKFAQDADSLSEDDDVATGAEEEEDEDFEEEEEDSETESDDSDSD